jgi:hypothetical protein
MEVLFCLLGMATVPARDKLRDSTRESMDYAPYLFFWRFLVKFIIIAVFLSQTDSQLI